MPRGAAPGPLPWRAMTRVFSGIQPTGELHLGNLLGAIRKHKAQSVKYKVQSIKHTSAGLLGAIRKRYPLETSHWWAFRCACGESDGVTCFDDEAGPAALYIAVYILYFVRSGPSCPTGPQFQLLLDA